MQRFDDLKVSRKLALTLGTMCLLILGMAIFSALSFMRMGTAEDAIYRSSLRPIQILGDMNTRVMRLRGDVYKAIYVPSEFGTLSKNIMSQREGIEKAWKEYRSSPMDLQAERKQAIEAVEDALPTYLEGGEGIVGLMQRGEKEESIALIQEGGDFSNARRALSKGVEKLIDLDSAKALDADKAFDQQKDQALLLLVVLTLVLSSMALGLGILLSRSITGPLQKGLAMMQAMSLGDLRTRLKMRRKDEIGKLADAMDTFSDDLKGLVTTLQKISAGDLSTRVEAKGAEDEISPALRLATDNIRALVVDAQMLSQAAVEGKLSTRADASQHQGDYRKIVEGVNACLDSVIGPLNGAAGYIDKISKGDIPPLITNSYNGDFNVLKNNLNTCIAAVDRLVTDATLLSKSAVEGKLSTRADASKHQGDFRKIVEGVNQTLDAVISPMNEAVEVMQQVARRDLTVRVEGQYQGDLSKMKDAINIAVGNLDEGLQQVSSTTVQVATAAEQISSGSQGLSQGASEQASSLEEISSSIEEMSSQTRKNADNAHQAKALSESARQSADRGNEAMGRMQGAISEIKNSSDATAKILKTIDEIAFQTNLLALNAAVEAARAGESGKGFAVVAEEVRNLAKRSADAARNTETMITASVASAERGVRITEEVAKALAEIMQGSTKVNDLVGEIAEASQEQRTGIDQINIGVSQLNTVTQSNAASAEESASASEELSAQAQTMEALVRDFKLSGEPTMTGRRSGSESTEQGGAGHPKLHESLGKLSKTPVMAKFGKAALAAGGSRPESITPLSSGEMKSL